MPRRRRLGDETVLARGEVLRGRREYQVREYLGRGGFALGYRVVDHRGEERFLKEFLPPEGPGERRERERLYESERDILSVVSGYELCPRLLDAFSTEGLRYLVQDYIAGEDLESRLAKSQRVSEERLLRWSVCLCNILAYLHARQIAHCDLKPANVRLNDDDDPVVIDFGAARRLTDPDPEPEASYGTEGYLPPELANGASEAVTPMQRDVFALGRILVEMLVGAHLSQEQIFARKETLCGELLHSRSLPPEFARAVFRSLSYDPAQRYPSAREMLRDLLSIAPSIGRVRPRILDFGSVTGSGSVCAELICFNVGGGILEGEVSSDCPWLEANASGVAEIHTRRFRRNRQIVLVRAHPERIATRGLPVEGVVKVRFATHEIGVVCRLEREGGRERVVPSATRTRLSPRGGGWIEGSLGFRNEGERSALVRWSIPGFDAHVEPREALLDEGGEVRVSVTVNASGLGEGRLHLPLEWHVNECRQTPINLEAGKPSRGPWRLPLSFARRGR